MKCKCGHDKKIHLSYKDKDLCGWMYCNCSKFAEQEYYPTPDQTLPEPPFNVEAHWTIPIIIIGGLLTVVVGCVAFGLYVYYTTPELWIQ